MRTTTQTQQTSVEIAPAGSPDAGSGLLWPILLIAGLTAYTGFMIRGSYFFADDFLAFGYAHQLGLTWSFLTLNLFGHIAPTERFLHYVPLAIAPFNYAVGETIILILYAGLLSSFFWVLRELRVGLTATLTLLFVVGTSTILLNEALYYDQTVFLLPASIFILCVTALFIRWCRSGRVWPLVASWFVFAASFVTQERPLVVLVYLVLLRYVVLPYRQAPGGKRRWLSDWRLWLPFAVVGAAYIGWYLSVAPNSSTESGTIGNFLRLICDAFLRLAAGLPITGSAWIAWAVFGTALMALIAVLLLSERRMLVLRSAVFFLVCFLVNLGVVFHGVGGVAGATGVANQIQYYVDTLFALGIAIGTACSPWIWHAHLAQKARGRRRHARRESPTSSPRRGVATVAFVCVALVAIRIALLPFGISSVNRANGAQPVGRSWMEHLESSLEQRGARPVTIVPLTMPTSLVFGFDSPFDLESETLPLLRDWPKNGDGPVKVIGPTGALLDSSAGDSALVTPTNLSVAEIDNLRPAASPTGASCYRGTSETGTLIVALPHPVSGAVLAFDMSIATSKPMSMLSVSVGRGQPQGSHVETSVPKGTSRVIAVLPPLPPGRNGSANPVTAMGFVGISPHSRFCLTALQVGAVVESDGKSCSLIDVYGSPTHVADCGTPWLARQRLRGDLAGV